MDSQSSAEFGGLLREDRQFAPPEAFRSRAHARDDSIYAEAERDHEGFWAAFGRELEWEKPWTTVLEWQPPHAKWFVGGVLNACVNCVDRHIRSARRNKAAIIWEGEPVIDSPSRTTISIARCRALRTC
jgi:acetyl-CoA synthetase